MSESIHGHEVMRMMLEMGTVASRESLEAAIIERFGTDARFHTCSAENLTPSQLIDFLESKGKIGGGDAYATSPDNICDHE